MEPISARYRDTILRMLQCSAHRTSVSSDDVLQPGNEAILPYIDSIIEDNIEPGSGIRSFDHLKELARLAREGATCLLLPEHYSTFDLPVISYLLRREGAEGEAIARAIVAIAGIKMSETDPVVSSFSEAYSRITIYPSRSIKSLNAGELSDKDVAAETIKSNAINSAAMRALGDVKRSGKIILVFPAGTRYRPWDPESKRGVREMSSYMRSFDYFSLMSINGNLLRINPEGEMKEDLVCRDRMVLDVSAPARCADFREAAKAAARPDDDPKQAVADAVMAALDAMHEAVAKAP